VTGASHPTTVGALEIGGTHASAALVDPLNGSVGPRTREDVDANSNADAILDSFAAAAPPLTRDSPTRWGVAMPGPFDYERGIALFHNVGKYESLYNCDVRTGLAERLRVDPDTLFFINDADAFALGEARLRGIDRLVGITLGTGIGSGWIADGHPQVDGPGVPPGGRINDPNVAGADIETRISRRAIRANYLAASGVALDVREIAERARNGEDAAVAVLSAAFSALGEELGPRLRAFEAQALVLGGSIAASWGLVEPWFIAAAGQPLPPIMVSDDPERSALLGAALAATSSR
jgi:glucokinase